MVQLTIGEWILLLTFLITVGTFIWRMAILHHDCKMNKESLIRAHDRIDKLEDTMSNKMEEFRLELKEITNMQIRLEAKLNILMDRENK